jgi:putative hemolysin
MSRVLRLDKINGFLLRNARLTGWRFIDEVFSFLNCNFSFPYRDLGKIPETGRLLIVANHPLGGLDGLILLKVISLVRKDVKILVNDFLSEVENLSELMLPFRLDSRSIHREAVQRIHDALQSDCAVIVFPAGEVSRAKWYRIQDGRWQKAVISLARKHSTPVLPVYINARNSFFFYFFSFFFKRLSMFLLPGQLFNKSGKVFRLSLGNVIPGSAFADSPLHDQLLAKLLRKHLYRISRGGKPVFKTEETIIRPADKDVIAEELSTCEVLFEDGTGKTVYEMYAERCPETMREIGRLREITFRLVGEGKGTNIDTDTYDYTYTHLVLWNDAEKEIIGAYRIKPSGQQAGAGDFYTSSLFEFTPEFLKLLPFAAELGRSFIQAKYWRSNALDCLWIGIGTYLQANPNVQYLFGPVSISGSYHKDAVAAIACYYTKWYSPDRPLVRGKNRFIPERETRTLMQELFRNSTAKEDFAVLKSYLKNFGNTVPVLFRQYADLCEEGGVRFAGFNTDPDFGNCVDGFLLLDLPLLTKNKRERYFRAPTGTKIRITEVV